jgi:hypothetical protein
MTHLTREPKLRTYWKEGSRIWLLVDISTQAEEPYFHLELVKGSHIFPKRVVDEVFFWSAVEVNRARVWRKVKGNPIYVSPKREDGPCLES